MVVSKLSYEVSVVKVILEDLETEYPPPQKEDPPKEIKEE